MLKLNNQIKQIVVESRMTVQPTELKGQDRITAERGSDVLSHWKGMVVFDALENNKRLQDSAL